MAGIVEADIANKINVVEACSLPFPKSSSGRDGKELLLDAWQVYQMGENALNQSYWQELKSLVEQKVEEAHQYCKNSTSGAKSKDQDKARRLRLARAKAKALILLQVQNN